MTFPNILKNPGLENWYERQKGYDHQWKLVVIEQPFDWEYVYIPGLETSKTNPPDKDYWRIPQSLHWDSGMKIAAGWMVWQAGYKQRVTVKAGQRYAAIARFHVTISGTQDPNAVQWMFYSDGLTPAQSQWSAYSGTQLFGQPVEHQFVFQADTDGIVDLTFWGRCQWADNAAEMFIRSIELVEVPQDYGEAAPVIPFPEDTTDPGGTVPEPIPTYELLGCHPVSWLMQLLGKTQAYQAQRTELYPGWDAFLFPLFLFVVVGAVLGTILYSVIQPRLVVQVVGVQSMEYISIDQTAAAILTAILSGLIGLVGSPVVVNLTALFKRLPFMQKIPAEFIAYPVAGLLAAGFWIAQALGVEPHYMTGVDILKIIVAAAVSIVSAIGSGQVVYNQAVKRGWAVLGYKRS